jgi:hypothetical protein
MAPAQSMGTRFSQRFTQFKSFFDTTFRKSLSQTFNTQNWLQEAYSKFKNIFITTTNSTSFTFFISAAGLAGAFFMFHKKRGENEKAVEAAFLKKLHVIANNKDQTTMEKLKLLISACKTSHDKKILKNLK